MRAIKKGRATSVTDRVSRTHQITWVLPVLQVSAFTTSWVAGGDARDKLRL